MTARIAVALAALGLAGCAAAAESPTETAAVRATATATAKPIRCSLPDPTTRISTRTPSQPLLDAFAVLRRPSQATDRPPAAAIARAVPMSGLMVDAARALAPGLWLMPVEDVFTRPVLPARCLKNLPAWQRREIRKAEQEAAARGPVEGVALVSADPAYAGPAYALDAIRDGQALQIDGCAGPRHNRLGLHGLVTDAVSAVTVTARDGSIAEVDVKHNRFALELPRPDSPDGLPAHVTYTTANGPQQVELPSTRGLTQPCEPPSRSANGDRREPIPLKQPAGAQIELGSARWEAEDTGPELGGATYKRDGRRCLLIDTVSRLKQGKGRSEFCVDDAQLRRDRYIARATRMPNGDIVLEGFADPDQIAWVTMERSNVISGARRLPISRRTGAFFVAHKGPRNASGFFKIRVALRGTPVHYTRMRRIELPALP